MIYLDLELMTLVVDGRQRILKIAPDLTPQQQAVAVRKLKTICRQRGYRIERIPLAIADALIEQAIAQS